MKFAKHIFFIFLSIFCFSQLTFASDFSEKFITTTDLNPAITHSQTVFDTEKESHAFIATNTSSEMSQISQRKKVDLSSSNSFTSNNFSFLISDKKISLTSTSKETISIKRLFLSEYSPHAP